MFHASHSIVVGKGQTPGRWTKCEFCSQCTCHDEMKLLQQQCPDEPKEHTTDMPKRFELTTPIAVEAIRLTPDSVHRAAMWTGGVQVEEVDAEDKAKKFVALNIPTNNSENPVVRVQEGDYIVKDPRGRFSKVSKEEFEQYFHPVAGEVNISDG